MSRSLPADVRSVPRGPRAARAASFLLCGLALVSTAVCAARPVRGAEPEGSPRAVDAARADADSRPSIEEGGAKQGPDLVLSDALHKARAKYDWSEWRKLPVLDKGRVKPLDTLADETVTLVVGRSKWTAPAVEGRPEFVFKAPELLYLWIADPDRWLNEPIIRCEFRPLRDMLSTEARPVPTEGTFVSVQDVLDWEKSKAEGKPVYRSQAFADRIAALDQAQRQKKSPDQVGENSAERALNGKVAELFGHLQTFLGAREARRIFVAPGLDPRVLTLQTNPDDSIPAWISFGALLRPDRWETEGDVTVAAARARRPYELLVALLQGNYPPKHVPQVARALDHRGTLEPAVLAVSKAFDDSYAAYAAADPDRFSLGMQGLSKSLRKLAEAVEAARPAMTPPKNPYDVLDRAVQSDPEIGEDPVVKGLREDMHAQEKAGREASTEQQVELYRRVEQMRPKLAAEVAEAREYDFGREYDTMVWLRYEPIELNDRQMALSAYPPAGSTDVELRYNEAKPFAYAWIFFLVATIVVGLSFLPGLEKPILIAGTVAGAGAVLYSAWGFLLRIQIAGRPPVTNMYETVIWVAFVVAVLGLWFSVIPFTFPGLKWSWRLAGPPVRLLGTAGEGTVRPALDKATGVDARRFLAPVLLPVQLLATALRVGVASSIVWLMTCSDTTFAIVPLLPPGLSAAGEAFTWGGLGTWCLGMAMVLLGAWYAPRAAFALLGSLVTIWTEAGRESGSETWEKLLARRFFLVPALATACFGMMLAHFVGIYNSEILDPKIGSIAAVLRNNYWLTIHVLTIVSSYGAGALAWGVGNVGLLFYLLGSYRKEGPRTEAAATGADERIAARLAKAGRALSPARVRATLLAGFADFGQGDTARAATRIRPPEQVGPLANYAYRAMQVAVLLLAAGTILGGLWADVSWGRFWDWDPKEVWALISLLAYLVVLHGRFAGWVGTFGTNVGSVLCFNAILMSWYGVNFVLPQIHGWLKGTNQATEVGLHSYATGAGGLEWVVTAVLANLGLVALAFARYTVESSDALGRHAAAAARVPDSRTSESSEPGVPSGA